MFLEFLVPYVYLRKTFLDKISIEDIPANFTTFYNNHAKNDQTIKAFSSRTIISGMASTATGFLGKNSRFQLKGA